ncbi:hypothetical protein MMC30_001415 [Trapelia coarctata]|nr:hypothetical protein [Trapelia coarctata]
MASLRRSTAMPTDGATSRFLYTILKQLDHKSIDWNSVASDLDITNGHAARMRFSRFKQHMEGVPPTPRKPRSDAGRARKAKAEKTTKKEKDAKRKKEQEGLKSESTEMAQGVGGLGLSSGGFGQDNNGFGQENGGYGQGSGGLVKPEPYVKPEPFIKPEPVVKAEPMDDAMDYERSEEPRAAGFADVDGAAREALPMQMQGGGDTGYVSPYAPVQDYKAGSAMSGEGKVSVKAKPVEM